MKKSAKKPKMPMPITRRKLPARMAAVPMASGAKLPNTITGAGWKIVNINKLSECMIALADKKLVEAMYEWSSDVLGYEDVREARRTGEALIPIGAVTSSAEHANLLRVNEKLAGAVVRVAQYRCAMVDSTIEADEPMPFALLAEALSPRTGRTVIIHENDVEMAVVMTAVGLRQSFGGRYLGLEYKVLHWLPGDGRVAWGSGFQKIYPYSVPQPMSRLGINTAPSADDLSRLAARGRRACDLSARCAYVQLNGNIEQKMFWNWQPLAARGRALVDPTGHALVDPRENMTDLDVDRSDRRAAIDHESLTDEQACCVEPYLTVYSLTAKKWGRTTVDKIDAIKFRTNAFEKLVLPLHKKRLLMALVKNVDSNAVSDIVDGKGGGCALLLHGPPGLGKTLSAETAAESLQRPLYVVGASELGTDADHLETRLGVVLQLAQRWNAVLLLDEADVFLEKRSEGDVNRNAMVGTFLRLVEYYNGVLVLTTNRVQHIDPAFYSRISLAFRFDDFSVATRAEVIENLLSVTGMSLSKEDIASLAERGVNGRQLKNALRSARALAKEEGRAVRGADVVEILSCLAEFNVDTDEPAPAKPQNGGHARVTVEGRHAVRVGVD